MAVGQDAVQAAVEERDDARYAALLATDVAALADLLDDQLVYVHTTGDEDTKASLLDAVASGFVRYERLDRQPGSIAVHGDTVLCSGRQQGMSYLDGKPAPIDSAYLAVWVRRDGAWRLAAWHATRYARTR